MRTVFSSIIRKWGIKLENNIFLKIFLGYLIYFVGNNSKTTNKIQNDKID